MKVPGTRPSAKPRPTDVPPEYVLAAAAHMNTLGKLFDAPPAPASPDVPAQ